MADSSGDPLDASPFSPQSPKDQGPHRMPDLSGGSATPSSQSSVREFAEDRGRLWSAVLKSGALIFTAIDATRGGTRAMTVDLTTLDDRSATTSARVAQRRPAHRHTLIGLSVKESTLCGSIKGSEIRNIAVVGHGASGKTSLVDALAFVSGSSRSATASVKDGTALTDTAPEEIERGYSINLGCAYAEWQDTKINLIDTPGYLDFQGDAIAGLAAADGALCVVRATPGVEVGTERMFREAVARRDPVLFVVSMMDKEHADFDRIYQQIKTRLTNKVIPVEIPVGQGADFHGIVNLFTKKAHVYKRGAKTGEYQETDIPAEAKPQFDQLLQRADRDDLGDRRHAARALSRGRRDLARRSDRRNEGSDEAHGALPALLRLVRAAITARRRCSRRSSSSCRTRTRWRSCTRSRAPKATRRSRSTPRTTGRSPRTSSRRCPSRTSAT